LNYRLCATDHTVILLPISLHPQLKCESTYECLRIYYKTLIDDVAPRYRTTQPRPILR
jgi:hypothetical protein